LLLGACAGPFGPGGLPLRDAPRAARRVAPVLLRGAQCPDSAPCSPSPPSSPCPPAAPCLPRPPTLAPRPPTPAA